MFAISVRVIGIVSNQVGVVTVPIISFNTLLILLNESAMVVGVATRSSSSGVSFANLVEAIPAKAITLLLSTTSLCRVPSAFNEIVILAFKSALLP